MLTAAATRAPETWRSPAVPLSCWTDLDDLAKAGGSDRVTPGDETPARVHTHRTSSETRCACERGRACVARREESECFEGVELLCARRVVNLDDVHVAWTEAGRLPGLVGDLPEPVVVLGVAGARAHDARDHPRRIRRGAGGEDDRRSSVGKRGAHQSPERRSHDSRGEHLLDGHRLAELGERVHLAEAPSLHRGRRDLFDGGPALGHLVVDPDGVHAHERASDIAVLVAHDLALAEGKSLFDRLKRVCARPGPHLLGADDQYRGLACARRHDPEVQGRCAACTGVVDVDHADTVETDRQEPRLSPDARLIVEGATESVGCKDEADLRRRQACVGQCLVCRPRGQFHGRLVSLVHRRHADPDNAYRFIHVRSFVLGHSCRVIRVWSFVSGRSCRVVHAGNRQGRGPVRPSRGQSGTAGVGGGRALGSRHTRAPLQVSTGCMVPEPGAKTTGSTRRSKPRDGPGSGHGLCPGSQSSA